MRLRSLVAALPLLLAGVLSAGTAGATRTLQDYRYFRALSIDLVGRMPTNAEITQFEQDSFDLNAWIETNLATPAYAERIRRIYMDLLRLEIGTTFQYVPSMTVLRRQQITGPTGQPIYVYFRHGQRRAQTDMTRMDTDGDFCLTPEETGLQFPSNAEPTPYMGGPHPVSQAVLDQYTVMVKPWWLYSDYQNATPTQLYSPAWNAMFPGFVPVTALLSEADGSATTQVRVCREEAQTPTTGTIWVSSRPSGTPLPPERIVSFPGDSSYARSHVGQSVSCLSGTAYTMTDDCGCGVGLQRCTPSDDATFDPSSFSFPLDTPIGFDQPTDETNQPASSWNRFWWSQEAIHFMDSIFQNDSDFRGILTSPGTVVNGPLVQFYNFSAPSTCCGTGTSLGYTTPQPLFDPANLPDLLPQDTSTWVSVANRGPEASGIMTMPIFLTKFGSRRSRAHVLYNAFLCRDFVAANVPLPPSTEPNLMIRPGCNACHATLEPLAAYFSRIIESDWTYLPAAQFTVQNPTCAMSSSGTIPSYCSTFYDPAFTDTTQGTLRGSYPDLYAPQPDGSHTELGPAGIASLFMNSATYSSVFKQCVVNNIAGSFLGRPLTTDDETLSSQLLSAFAADPGGALHIRSLVRAIIQSDAYHLGNNESPTVLRSMGGAP